MIKVLSGLLVILVTVLFTNATTACSFKREYISYLISGEIDNLKRDLLSCKSEVNHSPTFYFLLGAARLKASERNFEEAEAMIALANKAIGIETQQEESTHLLLTRALVAYAKENYEESLQLLTECQFLLSTYSSSKLVQGIVLHYLGNVNATKFYMNETALYYYEQAKKLLEDSDSKYHAALLNLSFARVYQNQEELETSIVCLNNAENFFAKKNMPHELAACLSVRAIDFMYRGDTQKAIQWGLQAVEAARKSVIANSLQLTILYDNLGTYYLLNNDPSNSYQYYVKGLELAKQNKYTAYWASNSYLNLGQFYMQSAQKNDSLARHYLQLCYELRRQRLAPTNPETAVAMVHLGDYWFQHRNFQKALAYYQKALVAGAPSTTDTSAWAASPAPPNYFFFTHFYTLHQKAKTFHELYLQKGELRYLRQSHNISREIKTFALQNLSKRDSEESKYFVLSQLNDSYNQGIETAHLLYEATSDIFFIESAFEMMEAAKNSVLLFELKTGDHKDAAAYRSKKGDMQAMERTLQVTKNVDSVDAIQQKLNVLRQEVVALNRVVASLQAQKEPETNTRAELRELKKNDALALNFFWGPESVYEISAGSGHLEFRKIEITDSLLQALNVFQEVISSPPEVNSLSDQVQKFSKASRYLCQVFFKKVPLFSQLLVSPHGRLQQVPFEAFLTQTTNSNNYQRLSYLLKVARVSYCYSFSIQQLLQKREPAAGTKSVIFGSLQKGDFTLQETTAVREITKGDLFVGLTATRRNFIEQAPLANVLHIASHGIVFSVERNRSYLDFAGTVDSTKLFQSEIYGLNLKASLVFLSACSSSQGVQIVGEGVLSLARAFFSAGAHAVVCGIWNIPAAQTSAIVKKFYEVLQDEGNVAESLRQAKTEFITASDGIQAHPYYWAGLLYVGNVTDELLIQKQRHTVAWVFVLVASGLLVIVAVRYRSQR
jgi:hypothetical protein